MKPDRASVPLLSHDQEAVIPWSIDDPAMTACAVAMQMAVAG
jgi:hypothetical protein